MMQKPIAVRIVFLFRIHKQEYMLVTTLIE